MSGRGESLRIWYVNKSNKPYSTITLTTKRAVRISNTRVEQNQTYVETRR